MHGSGRDNAALGDGRPNLGQALSLVGSGPSRDVLPESEAEEVGHNVSHNQRKIAPFLSAKPDTLRWINTGEVISVPSQDLGEISRPSLRRDQCRCGSPDSPL